jgi:integrase
MPRKGGRGVRIAPGIHRDGTGYSVKFTVATKQHEKRFPADTPLELMQAWQLEERAYYLLCAQDDAPAKAERGSLAADVTHYLKTRVGRSGYKADRSHLQAWVTVYGPKPRHKLTTHDAQRALATWLSKGKSPKTIQHRRRVLRELYRALDGRGRRTPVDGVKIPSVPKPHPVPVSAALIQKVAKSLKAGKRHAKGYGSDSDKTHARFLVYALSGQRPIQIKLAKPEDFDHTLRLWYVRPVKGGHPIPLPMSAELAKAWARFAAVDAWGWFDSRSFSKTLRRHGWPTEVRPYALRHTFAIAHLLAGTDLGDVQGLLGHANIQTTRHHYAPVLLARLEAVRERRTLDLDDETGVP